MKGLVQEIKFGEGGKVLTVVVYDPFPPYHPGFRTEADAAGYDKASEEYLKEKQAWEALRLGRIIFEYEQ